MFAGGNRTAPRPPPSFFIPITPSPPMIGTIVNTCTILVGSVVGALLHRGIKERYKVMLYDALGLASIAIGLNATITNFPKSEFPVLFILALSVGGVAGTWLDIDGRFHRLVNRRAKKRPSHAQQASPLAGNGQTSRPAANATRPTANLADGLSTAILLYCIGPLSMLGPVISALQGDHTFLFTNATLDLVSSMIFASTYGVGMALAAPVLFCWQGLFYLVARLSSEAVSDALMAELLIVGGLMIAGSGLNLLRVTQLKVLNLLPALLVPVVWFAVRALL